MYEAENSGRRLEWLQKQYSSPGVDMHEFHRSVNDAYYRFEASHYGPRGQEMAEAEYAQMLPMLRAHLVADLLVVDIGGGGGFAYRQLERHGVHYKTYVLVEPSQDMAEEFRRLLENERGYMRLESGQGTKTKIFEKSEQRVEIYRGEYDDDLDARLAQAPGMQKLVVANAVLHHLIDLAALVDRLKERMRSGDLFVFCQEPNNAYSDALIKLARVRRITREVIRRLRLAAGLRVAERKYAWERINEHLVTNKIVTASLEPKIIRSVIDYGIRLNWNAIPVPKEFDEGFWCMEDLLDLFGSQFEKVYVNSYMYLGGPVKNAIAMRLDRALASLLPMRGLHLSGALRKI